MIRDRRLALMQWDSHKVQTINHWTRSAGKSRKSRTGRTHMVLGRHLKNYEIEKPCSRIIGTLNVDIVIDNHIAILSKFPHSSIGKNVGHYKNGFLQEAIELLMFDANIDHVVSLVMLNEYLPNNERGSYYLPKLDPMKQLVAAHPNYAHQVSFVGILGQNTPSQYLPTSLTVQETIYNATIKRRLSNLITPYP